jgi:hypothetical protein
VKSRRELKVASDIAESVGGSGTPLS